MKTLQQFATRNSGLLIFFALLTLFLSQPHAGFMMILFMPPALFYQLVRLAIGWRASQKRIQALLAIAVVLLATAVVGGVHVHRHLGARAEADQLARRVLDFQEKQGHFPSDVTELGEPALPKKSRHMLHYGFHGGQPMLFYAATFVVFDTWQYDFSSQTWAYKFD